MSRLLDTLRVPCYIHAWCICGRHFMFRCDSLDEANEMRRKLRGEQCTGCTRNWSMFSIRSAENETA